jgi:Uma2 family endonuclease
MAIISPKLTYEHLRQLPDDGKRYEIVDGDLLVSPSPNRRHQETVGNTYAFLRRAQDAGFGKTYVAPFDVFFDHHNVTEPDVLFVSNERLGIIGENFVHGAPDIIVEVLSPGTRQRDEGVKLHLYGREGAPLLLDAAPRRSA